MTRSYEIHPQVDTLRGGWKLTLLENGQEAGDGIFPLAEDSSQAGILWWNALTKNRRTHWLMMAASAEPAAARHAYLLAQAYNNALEEGELWVGARIA